MKNLSQFINSANTPQNTGGGNSQNSAVVATAKKGSRPTVNRQSTDGQSQGRYTHTPLCKALKYAAMILLILTLGVGNAWGADQTYTVTNPETDVNTSGPITIQGEYASSKKVDNSNQKTYVTNNGPLYVQSNAKNIKSVTLTLAYTGNGSGTYKAITVKTMGGADFSTPASGVSAKLDDSTVSLSDIQVNNNNTSHQTLVITCTTPQSAVSIEKGSAGSIVIKSVSVVYDDAITAPDLYSEGHFTSTTAGTATNSCSWGSFTLNGATQEVSSKNYYKRGSETAITYNLASGEKFAEGDVILVDFTGSGASKTTAITLTNGPAWSQKTATQTEHNFIYVIPSGSALINATSLSFSIKNNDTYVYGVKVYHTETSGGGCTDVSISTQPTSPVAATVGSACSITGLVASGTNPTYQWQTCNSDGSNAANISAAGAMSFTGYTSATLGLTPTAEGATYYKCVVSGDCGDPVTSNVVTVNASPTYTVTYNSTGSDSGTAPSDATNYASGAAVTVLGNTGSLAKSGNVFAGWNTASTLDGTDYAPGTKFNISANTNLYPVWAEGSEETITYTLGVKNATSGSVTPSTHLTNLVNETNVGIAEVTDRSKTDRSGKYATSSTEGYGVSFTFNIADGYTFHPTSIAIQLATVSTTDFTFYVTLEDANGTKLTSNALNTFTGDGVLTDVTFPAYDKTLEAGTVTMLVSATRAGGAAGTYRIGKTITIKGAAKALPVSGYAITKSSVTNGSIAVTDGSDAITSADEEATVYIAATPNTGYQFSSWSIYETETPANTISPAAATASTSFTMPAAAVTVGATFTAINYDVTYTTPSNGSYTIQIGAAAATDESTTANYGQTVTLSATPSTGYQFSAWDVYKTGESSTKVSVSSNTFTMPAYDVTISASFEEIECPTKGTVFSASVAATSAQSFDAGASNVELTASQATVTGGSMFVSNGQAEAKNLIAKKGSTDYYFVETNDNTFFKIVLDCALEAGDVITVDAYGEGSGKARGVWITPSSSKPGSAPACAGTTESVGQAVNYTVTSTDAYHGEKTFYIYRATGNTTNFNNISITRPEKFDVTYYKNDGTDASIVATDVAVVAANEFTNSGYRFIEWNTQADGKGTTKAVGAAVTADIELFAIWAQEYSVSYANTGAASGAAPTNANKYIAGESFKVAGAGSMVAAENYVFGGWNDGSSTYAENDDYIVGSVDVSFAPVWNLNYNVTYNANGGTLPSGAVASVIVANNPSTIAQCQFLPEDGKVFAYWTDDAEGEGTQYLPGASISTTKVLYAQYQAVACADRQSITKAVLTSASAATTSGYNNKEYAGDAKINSLGGSGGSETANLGDGDVTGYKLASQYSLLFATLAKGSFQAGDQLVIGITKASGGSGQQLEIYAGSDKDNVLKVINLDNISAAGYYKYTLTAADATAINAAGYKSIGLYRSLGTGGQNPFVYSIELTGCRSWVFKHTVTFSLNGQTGTAPDDQAIEEGGLVTKPVDPEVAGQFFRGWYTDEECTVGNEWNFAESVMGDADMTLYAKWEADPCDNRRSIVKAVMASTTTATVTGYNENEYAGGYLISGLGTGSNQNTYDFGEGDVTGYKLAVEGSSIIMASLAKGGFVEGDKVIIAVTKAADGGKLPVYAAKDKNNVVSIANIDVTSPGIYTYTLTAANIATIEAAGDDYMSIGVYRGTYNPFIYSVELTGCRNWSVYHTLTFKNADGSATLASESLAEGAYASTIAPAAPRIKGKRFLGWSESVGGDVVNINEYTITENKILYIVYEDVDCPTYGTIYKFQFKTDLTNGNLDAATNADMSEYVNASGDGYLTYTSASAGQGKFANDSLIQFTNTAAYLKVDLDCALAAGDRIRVRCYNNPITVQVGTSYDSSKDLTFAKNDFGWQDVTEAMVGKSDLYITRASNGNANLAYVEIYRRPALTGVTMDDMRLKIGKTGTPVIHLLPSDDAIVTSQAWAITASTATGTTINTATGLITAGETTGEMTIQVTLNGDKVATASVSIVQGFEAPIPVTATTTWDWTPVATAANGPTISAPDTVLANYISGSGWENLSGNNGAYVYRSTDYKAFQGTKLSFKAAVPGKSKIYAGRISSDKKVYVNGIEVGTVTNTKAYLNEIVVPAGDVVITSDAMRIYNMTFDTNLDPSEAEESTLGGNEREVNPQYYGTICLPKAGVMTGATLFQIAYMDYKEDGYTPYKVYYDEVENGTMQAGMPYIFLAEQSTIGVYYTGTAEETAKDHNGLHGTLVNITEGMNATGVYMLYNNKVLHSTNPASYLNANRAYIQISEIPGYNDPGYVPSAPTRRRISTGFNGTNTATGLDQITNDQSPITNKVLINGQLFILRGEKLYDATGRLVK